MLRVHRLAVLGGMAMLMGLTASLQAQPRPYIGFVYPAGGKQGTTFQVRLGGQNLDDLERVLITGRGVTARVLEYRRRLGATESSLMREQYGELKKRKNPSQAELETMKKLETRMSENTQTPACASISNIAVVEVSIDRDAPPGEREIRLATCRAVSNPMAFHIGQLPEYTRKPMVTCNIQVLGKEELALRKRPTEEEEVAVAIPCTTNGQIGSGEVNRYRFKARKGQRLVISVAARQLIPYVADAVPGWFQPVLVLRDPKGKEVAYNDDYRFKPDPVILHEVAEDGEYVLSLTDAIFRGREDFVYRITMGEVPFVTSIFPLGGQAGKDLKIAMKGVNLDGAELRLPPKEAGPGVHYVTALRDGKASNRLPIAIDTLPEIFDKEPNNTVAQAQKLAQAQIVNGRIDRRDDWDVFEIDGKAGMTIIADVMARKLDSPLDSTLRITDAAGAVLAANDDNEDLAAGVNTHHADSYIRLKLPSDGKVYVHIGDSARNGGEEYAYRLRLSLPRPDFTLLAVPTSLTLRSKSNSSVTVQAVRKDGFAGPIRLELKDPPRHLTFQPVTLGPGQTSAKFTIATSAVSVPAAAVEIVGRAKLDNGQEIVRPVVAAEDRMQAFLWRHLVPAQDLQVIVSDPKYSPPARRELKMPATQPAPPKPLAPGEKPKFTKQQVERRIRDIRRMYEEGLLTPEYAIKRIAECEAIQ